MLLATFPSVAQTKKVVGYLPSYRFDNYNSIAYCKLTHLNICFANPDSNGNLAIDSFSNIIKKAREENPNIRIGISLGGGVLTAQQLQTWANLIDVPSNRPSFISKILGYVKTNDFDGVDFDLEWEAVTKGYSDFVIELKDTLKKHNILFTAALPATYRYPNISGKALETFDFINIMAYDKTGPWTPDNPGQHSSFEFAQSALKFWKSQGVPVEKLILGVPFYGYNFGNKSNIFSFSYASMVNTNVLYADIDQVGEAFYNGRPTIEQKVALAAQNANGIMIWEVAQDRFDEYSLLSVIHNKFYSLGITTTGLCKKTLNTKNTELNYFRISPNPASRYIFIDSSPGIDINVSVYNLTGTKTDLIPLTSLNRIEYDVSALVPGLYIVKFESKDLNHWQKLIIKH